MAQILVRDIDDAVVATLKERAKANHRSLQGEVKAILEREARRRMTPAEMTQMLDKWERYWKSQGRTLPSSVELIREDRDSR
jgi:plasmid stability protein